MCDEGVAYVGGSSDSSDCQTDEDRWATSFGQSNSSSESYLDGRADRRSLGVTEDWAVSHLG